MGHIFSPPLGPFVEFCAHDLGLPLFVETGTHRGTSAAWAADRFREVLTIELSPELFEQARRNVTQANVKFHCGPSPAILREMARRPEPKLFWLDAHWSGTDTHTAGVEAQCPVLEELAAVCGSLTDDVILIDDFHMFAVPPPEPFRAEQWPSLDELLTAVEPIRERRVFVFGNALIVAKGRTARPVFDYFRELPAAE